MNEDNQSNLLWSRVEVPSEDTWHLEDIFATDELWEEEFLNLQEMIPQGNEYKNRLAESAEVVYESLKLQDTIGERLGRLYTYAHMRHDEDTSNNKYLEMDGRGRNLYVQFSSTFSYVVPELLAMSKDKLDAYVAEIPEMSVYKQSFREIDLKRPHVLSVKEEEILAKAGDALNASSEIFQTLSNTDLRFPIIKNESGEDVELTQGRYITFLESNNREVRKGAFKAMYATIDKYKNTFASTLNGQVKKNNLYSSVKNYNSPRHASLSNNNIPEIVYDQLIDTVGEHLPLLHRYVDLRKKVLKVDDLHLYDLYVPLMSEVKMDIPYSLAKEYTLKGLAPMGKEYLSIVEEAFTNRWIDLHENRGKRSGAYSSGAYGTNPYILMNWQDNINNLFTLVHEIGHSVHSYYSAKMQPYQTSGYPIFLAEVASTCNEIILNDYLLKTFTEEKKQLYLLNQQLETFRGTIFRQTMFAEFEHLIHKKVQAGEPLTTDWLTEQYLQLNYKYFGNGVTIDKEIGLEWARIPHFYYNYYVYQYATGFSAAVALSKQILEEGNSAVARYIEKFLQAGSSDFPIEVLKGAGVDMGTKEPIAHAMKAFGDILNKVEQYFT